MLVKLYKDNELTISRKGVKTLINLPSGNICLLLEGGQCEVYSDLINFNYYTVDREEGEL